VNEQTILAELAAEYWKLLKAFDRSINLVPEEARQRLISQKKYSEGRLNHLSDQAGMRILSYDGFDFEVNLPVTAVNADEVSNCDLVVVEQTLEPTIMVGTAIVKTGKVFVNIKSKKVEE